MVSEYSSKTVTTEIVHDLRHHTPNNKFRETKEKKYHLEIVWRNVIGFIVLHIVALYGIYLSFTTCFWQTFVFGLSFGLLAAQGITAGAHRLWAHRAYKAKLPLRILLMFFQTVAFQNHIYEWVRDHRVHHKFTETDADPHNSKRGFFFAHMGWLMLKKHKDVMIKGKSVDMSDLEADPVVRFQRKYYLWLLPICCFGIPTIIPVYLFGENPWTAFYVAGVLRYVASLHSTWFVNSAAHLWGNKPYDKNIGPAENIFVAIGALGEGWHNYHHVFPWDYKTAELGGYKTNVSTMFIDFCAAIGLAYDLKTVSTEMIENRVKRTGDGSRELRKEFNLNENNDQDDHHHHDENIIWGWGDVDMKEEDIRLATVYNPINQNN